ncbi:MAG TPA: GGDEF domain-containing protein [Thermoleophilia bacterium]
MAFFNPSEKLRPPAPWEEPESQLHAKAQGLLRKHGLEITKRWLNQLIIGIDDFSSLDEFPTQENIRTSLELLQGLAELVGDESRLPDFQPGGRYYERAAVLGMGGGAGEGAAVFASISRTMLAFENAILEQLQEDLRRDDRKIMGLVRRLHSGLHNLMLAANVACWSRTTGELDHMAHTDVLTGLNNRRLFVQELERHAQMFKRYHHPFSIMMFDLDGLKLINDTLGHHAGDDALRHLAALLRASIRDVDIACRYGGDEFLVLMPDTTRSPAEVVGARIADAMSKTKFKVDHSLVTLEVSVGNASCPEDGVQPEELLKEADAGLYRSKQQKARARTGT